MQGIRGFALVLVLLCHAEMPFAQGGFVGLDIFFVLSGFLITRLLLSELERKGTISLLKFYARRARRLLPASLTVLAFVVLVSMVLFAPVRADETAGDVTAAGLYFVNWRFVAESIDYFATGVEMSPVRHYWSLSVEEQFYLLWPLLLLGAGGWLIRRGRSARPALWTVVGVLGLSSLAYGIWFTGVNVEQAYFSTLARGWALALGGALALALPLGLRMPTWLSALVGGGAVALLTVLTVVFTDGTPYPGWQALLPTLATAAFILAGTAVRPGGPVRFLTREPFQYLGRISYSWYLWHWPLIVFAIALWGELSPLETAAVIAVAWLPATITHHAIEERFRRSRTLARQPRRALALGFGCTAAAAALGVSLAAVQPSIPTAPTYAVIGAEALRTGNAPAVQKTARAISPNPKEAKHDRGQLFEDGCLTERSRTTSRTCVYGDKGSRTTIVLFGDSHTLQYSPALLRLARTHGWRLVGLMRAGCPVADVSYLDGCDAWRANTLRRIERRERPDVVITSSSTADRIRVRDPDRSGRLSRRASQPILEAGYARTLRRLKRTGAKVLVLRDQAKAPSNPADCVAEHFEDLRRCAFKAKRSWANAFDARGAKRVKGVRVVDPLRTLCPKRRCAVVIGDALVYRDVYHLSATFARTLAPWFERKLRPLLPKTA